MWGYNEIISQVQQRDVDLHRIKHTVANILEKMTLQKKILKKILGNTKRVLEEFYIHFKKVKKNNWCKLIWNVKYVDINIDLVAKIINKYPIENFW